MNWKLGLNFYSSKAILFNPSDIDSPSTKQLINSDKYHIYIIGKRKKLFFDNSSELNENQNLSLFYTLDENHNKQLLKIKHDKELKINSYSNGFYNIDFKDEKGLEVRDFIVINNFFYNPNQIHNLPSTEKLPTDLEVLYIGQAFGRKSVKKIDYRLRNHEKLQKVVVDVLNSASNEEVLIIGLKVEANDLTTSVIEDVTKVKTPTIEDLITLRDKARQRVPEGQSITIFEASLINYFRPQLNTEYKETFPALGFKSYEDIYNTDFNYSNMTIDTSMVGVRLFSECLKPRHYIHSKHFPLQTNSEKRTFFEYLLEEE